jgi:predicted dehydrogenase
MTKLNVLLIGCGNIAGGYDLLQPDDALPLGHAKAFLKHGGFELAACVEPDDFKRAAFQQRWNIQTGYSSLQNIGMAVGKFDVISICSSTSAHSENIKSVLPLKPKLIFCEKPVTSSLHITQLLVKACEDQQVLLAVNYSRRWSPQVVKLKSEIADGYWGAVRSVSAVYNKGILNNGTHMLDLLLYLFGPLSISSVGQAINDFFSDDPSVDAVLLSEQCIPIQLNVAHAQDYALFEMQIVTERGVINMEDGGERWRFRLTKASDRLAGYHFLNSGEWVEPKGSYALTGAVSNLYEALKRGAPLASTGLNALEAQSLCEKIKQMIMAKNAPHTFQRVTL